VSVVDTKRVTDRRELSFSTMDDLLADVEGLGAEPMAAGNWTPGQVVEHVTILIESSLDGFTFKAPLPLRIFARLARGRFLSKTLPAGVKLPANASALMPSDDVTWDDAVARLRRATERIRGGDRMTHPSPLFGALSHEQWVDLHCRHAEMHLSFLRAG
jgi:hypothetical protein